MAKTAEASTPRSGDALLVVDVQRDFMPGGALGVPAGDRVLAPLNRCIARFAAAGAPVFASRDWHPADHCSFADRGGPWPVHCVAGSPGAAFDPGLELPPRTEFVAKATERDREAYSALDRTGLAERLQALGVRRLVIGGLATDYCVLRTVLDARKLGLDVLVLSDAIAAVDVRPGDGERAIGEMAAAGARLVGSAEVCA